MLTTSFLLILGVIIGFLFGRFFNKKGNVNWQSQFKEADANLQHLKKQQKKDKRKQQQLTQQKTALEDKLTTLEEKYIPLTKNLNKQIIQTNQSLDAKTESYDKLSTSHTRTEQQLDQLKKKYKDLQVTYATDLKDSKGWLNKRKHLEQEIASWKRNYISLQKENKTLKATLEKQKNKMAEVAKFTQEFKNMRAANRKLSKDLKYWEQKHFDTHHELAQSKIDIEALQAASKEAELKFKGAEIQNENTLKKIEEFKTKFVNINNLYHELKKEKQMA